MYQNVSHCLFCVNFLGATSMGHVDLVLFSVLFRYEMCNPGAMSENPRLWRKSLGPAEWSWPFPWNLQLQETYNLEDVPKSSSVSISPRNDQWRLNGHFRSVCLEQIMYIIVYIYINRVIYIYILYTSNDAIITQCSAEGSNSNLHLWHRPLARGWVIVEISTSKPELTRFGEGAKASSKSLLSSGLSMDPVYKGEGKDR